MDKDLRKELERLSVGELQKRLQKLLPSRWEKLNESDRQNPRRLIRAIELTISPRRSSFDFAQDHLRGGIVAGDILKIGLTAPRDILYAKVDERVLIRIKQGMIEEAKYLHVHGVSLKRMRQLGLEYGVLADYLDGKIREIEGEQGLIKIMQRKIHGYVRRQLTWFKNPSTSSGYINWFDITDKRYINNVEILVSSWYHEHNDKTH